MKSIVITLQQTRLLLVISVLLVVASCKNDSVRTRTYKTTVPIYINKAAFRAQSFKSERPRKLSVPGKIYSYGDYLLINEAGEGVHIVDNRTPSRPKFINFLKIPGNYDLAVNSNILYIDNYIDLLAFDISVPTNVKLIKRLEEVFPTYYKDANRTEFLAFKDTVITVIENDRLQPVVWNAAGALATSQSYGQGGSMARFTLMNSRLYTVNETQLKLFDVSNPQNPLFIDKINLGWGIETIFPYQNKLFIGSTTGMHIYDATNPSSPQKLSTYRHVTSCDPVVVSGNYAYVTLRSGNFCQQGVNLLEVLNVEDPKNPKLVKSFAMQNPHGLGLSGNHLFICEGDYGLKSFNASNPLDVGEKLLQHVKSIKATDVIPGPKSLIVTGEDGIYQFNYSNPGRLTLLSKINIGTEDL
jgi:hypothetical protein